MLVHHLNLKMFEAEAVDYAQPSVTKVGGITEFNKVVSILKVMEYR